MSFICHIHNYTEYNEEWNVFSAFNPSKWSSGQPTLRRPGSSWGFGALLKGLTSVVDTSCQSRDSNPQPRVTLGFKSNALSIRPRLPPVISSLKRTFRHRSIACNLLGFPWFRAPVFPVRDAVRAKGLRKWVTLHITKPIWNLHVFCRDCWGNLWNLQKGFKGGWGSCKIKMLSELFQYTNKVIMSINKLINK